MGSPGVRNRGGDNRPGRPLLKGEAGLETAARPGKGLIAAGGMSSTEDVPFCSVRRGRVWGRVCIALRQVGGCCLFVPRRGQLSRWASAVLDLRPARWSYIQCLTASEQLCPRHAAAGRHSGFQQRLTRRDQRGETDEASSYFLWRPRR